MREPERRRCWKPRTPRRSCPLYRGNLCRRTEHAQYRHCLRAPHNSPASRALPSGEVGGVGLLCARGGIGSQVTHLLTPSSTHVFVSATSLCKLEQALSKKCL